MTQPFFSIIIPMFNSQNYIARAIASCKQQSFSNIEIVVIDDCSQDLSIKIVQNYLNDGRIKLFKNPSNFGTFKTRLEGIKHSKGKYCLFLDSDDFIQSTTCELLYETIKHDFYQTFQYTDIVGFGSQYYPKSLFPIPHIPCARITNDILFELFIKPKNPSILIWNKAYRSNVLKQICDDIQQYTSKLPYIKMGDDVLQSFLIYCYAQKSIGIKEKKYYYCDSLASITRKQDVATRQIRIKNLRNLLKTINLLGNHIPYLKNHYLFQKAKYKLIRIIQSSICLERRYNKSLFAYPKSCLKSLRFYKKKQTYIRIIIYFISFGIIKI